MQGRWSCARCMVRMRSRGGCWARAQATGKPLKESPNLAADLLELKAAIEKTGLKPEGQPAQVRPWDAAGRG